MVSGATLSVQSAVIQWFCAVEVCVTKTTISKTPSRGWDTIQNSKAVGSIFDAMNVFLGAVGLVTLALGAIGVINIMLVTVSERTREIGLRSWARSKGREGLILPSWCRPPRS
jgi:hypothetical protein